MTPRRVALAALYLFVATAALMVFGGGGCGTPVGQAVKHGSVAVGGCAFEAASVCLSAPDFVSCAVPNMQECMRRRASGSLAVSGRYSTACMKLVFSECERDTDAPSCARLRSERCEIH